MDRRLLPKLPELQDTVRVVIRHKGYLLTIYGLRRSNRSRSPKQIVFGDYGKVCGEILGAVRSTMGGDGHTVFVHGDFDEERLDIFSFLYTACIAVVLSHRPIG